MKFEPKGNQGLAIDARGKILVSAAAGSGKTAVLSHRAVARILDPDNPVDVSDLLIVTFTNAAAAEMRQRISGVLSEYIAEHGGSPRALKQKAELDTAAIGTIDAFCIDLVRENFEDESVDVRPDFRVMSEERLALMRERIANETLLRMMQTRPDDFHLMATTLWREGSFDFAVDGLIDLYKYTQVMPYPTVWLQRAIGQYEEAVGGFNHCVWTRKLLDLTAQSVRYHIGRLESGKGLIDCDETATKKYAAVYDELLAIYASLQAALASGDYDAVRAAFAVRPTASVGRQSCDEGLKNTLDEIRKAAKDYLEAGRERTFFAPAAEQEAHLRRVGKAVALLCECATAFSENMRKEMRSENCYDFNAIEHKALDLLCDCVDGAPIPKDKGIAHRYREVMVDEYQDTNDLQDAIFSALSDGGKNLFLVGDVKQCIYRFRRANPANFIQRRREYPAFAEGADFGRIDMSGNFRSRPGICDYVNHTFRLLMTEQSADMDYEKEDELIPMGENFADVGDQPVVSLHMVQTDGNTVEEEARYVAEALLKAHNEGLTVTDTRDGKRTGTTRPMKWSDVLILMRSLKGNTEMKARCYVKALERLCIPVDANTREDLSECEEVVLLLSLLRAVDNPLRDVPLLATLMSPMFDFSPDEIVRIRLHLDRDETNASLYTALMRDAEYEPKSRDFLAKLDRYRRWAGTLPADRLIRRIVDDAGLSAIAYRMENGANAYANLMLFIDYAAGYEAEGFRGLTAFLRYWDRIVKQRESVDCAMSQPSTDAVRILSVHGAKGLEAPIIVLADVAKDINTNDSRMSMIFDEDYGICAKYYDDEAAVCYETVAHTVAVAKSKRDTKAEELRLLYVAMTRATERLWLIVRDKDPDATLTKAANKLLAGLDPFVVSSATSVSEWVLAAALLHPDARRQLPEICRDVLSAPASGRLQIVRGLAPTDETEESAAPPATVCAAAELLEPLTYTYPYEDILRYDTKYAVSQLAKGGHRADDCCTSRPAFIGNERLTPAEKGTATHRFMCFADYALARESVPAEIDRLVSEGRLTREQGDGIDVGTVEAFFESDLYRRVLAADRVLKESRFLYEMPVCRLDPSCESRETVVVQGVADLVLIEPDGVTVIDFKTDRGCTAGELVERYARQLAIYTDAFAADRGLPKKTPYLYSFYLKQAIPVPGVATESEKM